MIQFIRKELGVTAELLQQKQWNQLVSGTALYTSLTFIILMLAAVFMPLLSFDYGVFWDERMSIAYSEDVLKFLTSWGEDRTCLDVSKPVYNHLIYYGNIFGVFTTLLASVSPFDLVETRHVVNSLLGFLTLYFTVQIARQTAGPKAGLLAAVLLLLMPRFFGHVMNDFRDTTFMCGYIGSIYYTMCLLRKLPSFDFKTSIKLTLFLFLTAGVRAGGFILFGLLAMSMFIHWIATAKKEEKFNHFFRYAAIFLGITAAAYLLTIAIWPWALQDPWVNPYKALIEFSQLYLIINLQHFRGELVINHDLPWEYLFVWMGVTIPIVILLGVVLNLIIGPLGFRTWKYKPGRLLIYLGLALPLGLYLYSVKNLYDSWRHFLFLTPMIVIMATWGWQGFISKIKVPRFKLIAVGACIILLCLPLRFMLANYPFHTIYFNELIGGVPGAYGKFELDIDANAARYGAEWLNDYTSERKVNDILLATNNDPLAVSQYTREGLFRDKMVWLPNGGMFQTDWDFAIVTPRTLSPYQLTSNQWPFKETIHTIDVDGVPVVAVMKRQDKNIVEGLIAMNTHRTADALTLFRKAVAHNPDHEEPLRLLAMISYEMGFLDTADSLLSRSLELYPESTFAFYYKARIAYTKKKYDQALKYIEDAREYRDNNPAAEQLKANILIHKGDIDGAETLFKDLMTRANIRRFERAGIYNDLANVYLIRAQQSTVNRNLYLNRATDLLGKAIGMNPDLLVAYQNLIVIYRSLGEEETVKKVQQAYQERLNAQAAQ